MDIQLQLFPSKVVKSRLGSAECLLNTQEERQAALGTCSYTAHGVFLLFLARSGSADRRAGKALRRKGLKAQQGKAGKGITKKDGVNQNFHLCQLEEREPSCR